jgi:hypothetical protein
METRKQPNNFIISLAGANIDTTIVTIEELHQYCSLKSRMAIVATEKKTYGELGVMNYQFIMNHTKPKVLTTNTKNRPYIDVYAFILEKYKNGLLVVECDTLSDNISDIICKSEKLEENDIDIMICRDGFEAMTTGEMRKANYLRIHADPDINLTVFQKLTDFYQEKVLGLMIAQLFVNDQYAEVNSYFEKHNERYSKQGLTDYVDYSELNKQLSYFIYFDVENNKIMNVGKDTLIAFMIKMKAQGLLPFPEDQLPVIAESLTNE